MIIDVHGHFTTAPPALQEFRDAQLAALSEGRASAPRMVWPDDAELRAAVEHHQLRVLRERGGDVVALSPRAAGMEHHVPDQPTAVAWARVCNDLVHRVCELFPDHVAGVAQLPQVPRGEMAPLVREARRCVELLGFVGVNLDPDPSGGRWEDPPLTDEHWFPLYEALVELDVPAMVHVSSSCSPALDTLGAHYLAADTAVFVQLMQGELFARFPGLRLVIPHGGGAVPFHWGRYRGLAARRGLPDPASLLDNVFFDTCVYHQRGVDLLLDVLPAHNVLFASEMLGAVRGADPETGIEWDDTLRYLRAAALSEHELAAVLGGNALRVYPRLARRLEGRASA